MDTKQIQALAADIYRVQSKGLDFCRTTPEIWTAVFAA